MNAANVHLFIFGAKSTALEIAETVALAFPGWKTAHVADQSEPSLPLTFIQDSQLEKYLSNVTGDKRFILSMADHDLRRHYRELAGSLNLAPQTIIHPDATVSASAKIGHGSYLAPGCRVSTGAIVGNHCLFNLNVSYGHHARCGEHVCILPGAAIGGDVSLGDRVLVGANAFVYQGVQVADDCQIDALTYVGRDLSPKTVCTSRQFRTFPRIDTK